MGFLFFLPMLEGIFSNTNTFEVVSMKYVCIEGRIVNGVRQPVFVSSFVLDEH